MADNNRSSTSKNTDSLTGKLISLIKKSIFTEFIDFLKMRVKRDISEIVETIFKKSAIALTLLIGSVFITYGSSKIVLAALNIYYPGLDILITGLFFLIIAFIIYKNE